MRQTQELFEDINKLLNFILTKLGEGKESILFLIATFAGEDTDINFDDIAEYIDDIGSYVNYYWYDDGIDNDGNNGPDEETINGLDDDGDGLIDEDTDRHPSDQSTIENSEYYDLFQKWYNEYQ